MVLSMFSGAGLSRCGPVSYRRKRRVYNHLQFNQGGETPEDFLRQADEAVQRQTPMDVEGRRRAKQRRTISNEATCYYRTWSAARGAWPAHQDAHAAFGCRLPGKYTELRRPVMTWVSFSIKISGANNKPLPFRTAEASELQCHRDTTRELPGADGDMYH